MKSFVHDLPATGPRAGRGITSSVTTGMIFTQTPSRDAADLAIPYSSNVCFPQVTKKYNCLR